MCSMRGTTTACTTAECCWRRSGCLGTCGGEGHCLCSTVQTALVALPYCCRLKEHYSGFEAQLHSLQ